MSGGNIEDKSQLSETILHLVDERQSFYQKYFSEGTNSDLVKIESEFDQTTMKKTSTGEIEVIEIVNLTGISKLQNAADYPPYQAALLALKMVEEEDQKLIKKLESYATDILIGVQQSIDEEEYTFSIVNKHTISVDYKKGIILEDYYSSEFMDDLGTDKVVMFDGKPERIEPDFSLMPDHMMYVTPIEELATILLNEISGISDDYSTSSGIHFISTNAAPLFYSGSSAAAYIRTYVRNTSLTPNCNGVLENQIKWNSSYNAYDCLDCANYVSQALAYGGMPTTATWQPYTSAWINVSSLTGYIISHDYGYYTTSALLDLGDLGMIPNQHVVMVSALNPLRYSGHTNDRYNYPWAASLTYCINVY